MSGRVVDQRARGYSVGLADTQILRASVFRLAAIDRMSVEVLQCQLAHNFSCGRSAGKVKHAS